MGSLFLQATQVCVGSVKLVINLPCTTRRTQMKLRKLFFAITAVAVMAATFAQALDLTWDSNGTTMTAPNPRDGGGTWLTANMWWDGATNVTWTSGDNATIGNGGAGGAITLGIVTAGSVTFTNFTGTYTLQNGILTNSAGITISPTAGTVTFLTSSTIRGAGGITMNGYYLNLNGATNNITGDFVVNSGTVLNPGGNGSLGSGNLTLNNGVLMGYWGGSFTRSLGAGPNQVQIFGNSGFAAQGSTGTSYDIGGTNTLVWGSDYFNPTTFVLQDPLCNASTTVTLSDGINLNGADRTISVNKDTGFGNLTGAIVNSSGTAGLIKTGLGTLLLSTANTYNGGTTISAGTLRFDTRNSMPAAGTVTVANGGTLGVTVAGSGTTWGGGTGVAGIAGLTSTANSGEGYGGQTGAVVNFDGNSFLDLNVTGNVTESNAIGDGSATSIRLIKSGGSSLTLGGTHTYSGGTTLSAGTLVVGATAVPSTGTIRLNGGTIQSSDATARTFSNAVTIGGDFTVGGTGNLTFSNTGASSLGATRQITVTTSGVNATFAQAFSGSGGITKAGAGTLTLTGTNSIGPVTVNAGLLTIDGGTTSTGTFALPNARVSIVNGGTLSTSSGSAALAFSSGSSMTVTGGNGVTSTWNLNGGAIGTVANNHNIGTFLIDGASYAGSARVTNVGTLTWGRTLSNASLILTNGGQMNVSGEIRTGVTYYNTNGNSDIIIGGGTATSTFTGNNQTFTIGYAERNGSKNNDVIVNSGGVLTGIGNMFVGHVLYGVALGTSMNNKLSVDGTGTANMASVTLGYGQVSVDAANANLLVVSNGGTLTTSSGANYIGRATVSGANANANTATVTGTGSSWNAGNQIMYVGYTGIAGAVSTGNVLTATSGGVVTNISAVIVKAANTLELGAGGLVFAGAVTNSGTLAVALDGSQTPACGRLAVTGNLNVTGATLNVTLGATATEPCVIATYPAGKLIGGFAVTNGLSDKYRLDMNYKGENKIAIVYTAAGTLIQLK
jgi:fibronectin-binding autotransporter adhesin